ncbi:5-oxoprolinase subunit PxpB [Paenibacillus sp. IITD108]|uniref:5-oxoprolinase subunit PxpB n=1 Tax=Paenibacillus sp. IITD108 TaxID=3116649 RepID=UPI002F419880
MQDVYEIEPLGECAVIIRLGERIDEYVHYKVMRMSEHLEQHPFAGWIEAVPSYAAVTIHYDPFAVYKSRRAAEKQHLTIYETISKRLDYILQNSLSNENFDSHQASIKAALPVIVPVCYGGEYGPDLPFVAKHCGLTENEVIKLHAETDYLVYMIGFVPGFPYLGGMPEQLATPRRAEPRLQIPAGSVGIAGGQTGIYPYATPGGWQLIGRSPVKLFDAAKEPPSYLQAGIKLRFEPITPEQYAAIAAETVGAS